TRCGQGRIEQSHSLVTVARLMARQEHDGILVLRVCQPGPCAHAGVHRQGIFKVLGCVLPAFHSGSKHTQITLCGTVADMCSTGTRARRDNEVSGRSAEQLNSATSSVLLQRRNRHGILGQKPLPFPPSLGTCGGKSPSSPPAEGL